jgi:hypothetical protein
MCTHKEETKTSLKIKVHQNVTSCWFVDSSTTVSLEPQIIHQMSWTLYYKPFILPCLKWMYVLNIDHTRIYGQPCVYSSIRAMHIFLIHCHTHKSALVSLGFCFNKSRTNQIWRPQFYLAKKALRTGFLGIFGLYCWSLHKSFCMAADVTATVTIQICCELRPTHITLMCCC